MRQVNLSQARDLSHLKNGRRQEHEQRLAALQKDSEQAAFKAGELLCDRVGLALEKGDEATVTTDELAWYESFARTAGASCTLNGNVDAGEFWQVMHEKAVTALVQRRCAEGKAH